MASIVDRLSSSIFPKATIVYKQQLSEHVYHIRIQSDSLKVYEFTAGDHIRLFVGIGRDTSLDSKLRTYSVWDHNSMTGTVNLAMCIHSSGIGATWIRQVALGEEIHYMGPKGKLNIDPDAESHLFISDASALSHMYAIRRHIPSGKKSAGIMYSSDASDHYADIDGTKPFQFFQLNFDPTDHIIEAANSLKNTLSEKPTIYLGGDARVCKSLSRYFRQNWPTATVRSKGFWMPGKTGMD